MIRFEIKNEHLELLRKAFVSYDNCEFGAPCIDSKRPYGNGDVYEDIAKILGIDSKKRFEGDESYYTKEEKEYMKRLHQETEMALQIILRTGKFETGVYIADWQGGVWEKMKGE